MSRNQITPKQLSAALRRHVGRMGKAVERAALNAAAAGVAHGVALTDAENLVDQGAYRRGWRFRHLNNGAEFYNDSPYAGVIEFGRRPGAPGPPLAPINAWAERKGIGHLAFAIRNAIHRNGTKPRFVMLRVRTFARKAFLRNIRAELAKL